ncbi:hypothetical protein IBE33_09440 [Francisella philomiragia]|uniref:VirB4 family type IV secretion/conjugal transfer ATPase n=1 Tax=Francisella philomiragia TaxID=28110 RepID=UPI001905F1A5|nr:hypothetical protein [Francisella philomiragia]MBK2341733.1 hypothetical protein [Francisella philomiragia]
MKNKSLSQIFKELDNKDSVADSLTYYWMLDDGIVYHKDGALSTSIRFFGPDLNSETDSALDVLTAQIYRAFSQLEEGWLVESNLISAKDNGYSDYDSQGNIVSRLINNERKQLFQSGVDIYRTDVFFTFTYIKTAKRLDNLKSFIFSSEKLDKAEDEVVISDEKMIADFKDSIKKVFFLLRTFGVRLEPLKDAELFKFLYDCVNCTDSPDRAPVKGFNKKALDHRLFLDLCLGMTPARMGAEMMIGDKHVRCLSLDDLPQEYYPTILHELSLLNVEFRWSSRFIYLSLEESLKIFKSKHLQWDIKKSGGFKKSLGRMMGSENLELDQHAVEMAEQVTIAETRAQYGARYGYMNQTIIVWDKDINQLNEKISKIDNLVRAKGFMARKETINTPQSFLGSLPSHGGYNARKLPVDLEVYANYVPSTGIYQGNKNSTFKPLRNYPCLLETVTNFGDRRYGFNYHKGTVGHTCIIGPVGTGKTVFQSQCISQWIDKYPNSRVIGSDSNNSLLATTVTHGGKYVDINRDTIKLNPFYGCDEESYKKNSLLPWLINVFTLTNSNIPPTVDQKAVITQAVQEVSSLKREYQNLSSFISQLTDEECKKTFSTFKMMLPNEILSGEDDSDLFDERIIIYDKLPIKGCKDYIARPLIDYMFDKMVASVRKKPTPTLMIMAEANYELRDSYMREKILDCLETLARHNQIAIIFDFQSPETLNHFGDSSVIKQNIATMVWLPNSKAVADEDIYKQYRVAGLNDKEIQNVANAIPNCEYFIKQEDGSQTINFRVGELSLGFTAIESKDKAAIDHLYNIYDPASDQWAYDFLEYRGVTNYEKI